MNSEPNIETRAKELGYLSLSLPRKREPKHVRRTRELARAPAAIAESFEKISMVTARKAYPEKSCKEG